MSAVVEVRSLTRRFGAVAALQEVTLDVQENVIYGLLGRNGAGKTTLLDILTGQDFETSGSVEVFGCPPRENAAVLSQVCCIKENQFYPPSVTVTHVLRAARAAYAQWDEDVAQSLLAAFALPGDRKVSKLSRGMRSAVGVTVGLASRAPLTLFDEPYVGLDAVARQIFYDRLLAEYAEHPRTVVLSTHLIDEVGALIERVVMLDRGRVVIDESADRLRERAVSVQGPTAAVESFVGDRNRLHSERMGSLARVTVLGGLDADERAAATAAGLAVEPVSLQQFVVQTSVSAGADVRSTTEEVTR